MLAINSANQLIYEYYHDISTAELKAYALVQLAYMFYTVYNRGMYWISIVDLEQIFSFYHIYRTYFFLWLYFQAIFELRHNN